MSKPKVLPYFGSIKTIANVPNGFLQKDALYSFEIMSRDSLHKIKNKGNTFNKCYNATYSLSQLTLCVSVLTFTVLETHTL